MGRAVDKTLDGKLRCVEDCCLYGYTEAELMEKIEKFLEACDENDITLNTKKVQFGKEVLFAGFVLREGEYKINPALTDALHHFPSPKSPTDVRSFAGLANQICHFTTDIAQCLKPLQDLLKKNQPFIWTEDHQAAFEKAREELSKEKWLTYYDHRRPTRLYTDASRLNGLGFILKQLVDGQWKVVQAGSRFLAPAETRYAMIELELLAIAWAAKKTAAFIEGIKFELYIDHKPLVPILEHYSLAEIENKRLQRLKMKIDHLQFEVQWIDGKKNVEADALSRAPVREATKDDLMDEENGPAASVNAIALLEAEVAVAQSEITNLTLARLKEAADDDKEYQAVKKLIQTGFAECEKVGSSLEAYIRERDELHFDDEGFVCLNNRLLIPTSLRQRYLDYLVFLHQGVDKMLHRARQSMWWPQINADIRSLAQRCRTCVERSPSNPKEPLLKHEDAKYPFQALHMDLGSYADKQWLIIVDQFSGWSVTKNVGKEASGEDICKILSAVFATYGIPERIYSDGGPQFKEKTFYEEFCKRNDVDNIRSSPNHPQSNGIAENGVKQMKKLIHCTYDPKLRTVDPEKWMRARLLYHNTPRQPSGLSPAQLLFGRDMRDGLPTTRDNLVPRLRCQVEQRLQRVREKQNKGLEWRRELPILEPGQPVFVQNPHSRRWDREGIIIGFGQNAREYVVEFSRNKKRYIRNRFFLKPNLRKKKVEMDERGNVALKPGLPKDEGSSVPWKPREKPTAAIRRSTRVRRVPRRFE
jgi:transposase InsO family protein